MITHRGLHHEEPLIFELDTPGTCGVDFTKPPAGEYRLGPVKPRTTIGLPNVSEPTVVRHFTRLSQSNYAIDTGIYPLGSCTMKYNPRLNEKMARLPGFAGLHPLQPMETVQGMLELIDTLAHWLKVITGMPAVVMSPGAGAQGELCGMMAIRAALDHRDGPSTRRRVLIPESAHGTNPASAIMCGFTVDIIPNNSRGHLDLDVLKSRLDQDVAAIMLTNPNTCGLFEPDVLEIASLIHNIGAFFYCDGANFNAIIGRIRPAELGIDAMHLNLHKTFSTPHGGGGPGSAPVVLSSALAPYVPFPYVIHDHTGLRLIENPHDPAASGCEYGRIKGFHGQVGMFIRTLAFLLSHGSDGLRRISGDAVLNANYLRAHLKEVISPAYDTMCMHEVLFDDRFLKGTNVTVYDITKAMIDEGLHPMTVYFPLIVHGAMLIEPTETETKRTLDEFIAILKTIIEHAKAGDTNYFQGRPRHTPRRRPDETMAARKLILRWKPS